MIYFTPTTSKKLEEMGLEPTVKLNTANYPIGTADVIRKPVYSTLDLCELENAKKLGALQHMHGIDFLSGYIQTLTDEDRVQYVEDYLKTL